jgi:hypothetical protein
MRVIVYIPGGNIQVTGVRSLRSSLVIDAAAPSGSDTIWTLPNVIFVEGEMVGVASAMGVAAIVDTGVARAVALCSVAVPLSGKSTEGVLGDKLFPTFST